MNKGRLFLSDLKLHSDYFEWLDEENRYEIWEEATKDVFDTHREFYKKQLSKSDTLVERLLEAEESYKNKFFLASQRNLQFRGNDIIRHNARMFNCCVLYADKLSFLGNAFYLLLCGCGVGVNMMLPFVEKVSRIAKRTKGTIDYTIEDSIEGWAKAAHVLFSSYSEVPVKGYEQYQGYTINFIYSKIRTKGSRVGRRFKAPGHEGIKLAFEKIVALLDSYVENEYKDFISILLYDCFMHLADAVLSGGVRRAACSIILSYKDKDLLYAKSGNWREKNPQRERSNNSVGLIRGSFDREIFKELVAINDGTSDIGFAFLNNIFEIPNPCFEIIMTPLYFDYNDKSLVDRIMASDVTILDVVSTGVQFCNLTEINGAAMKNVNHFLETCRNAAITGTFQAGYTNYPFLEEIAFESQEITKKEALLGVSITGLANSPFLLDAEVLRKGADTVMKANEEIASLLGINISARSTTIKPSGNSAVILGCASGIHPEHSEKYFRVMQLNKDTETAKWLIDNMPYLLEESVYSRTNTDYVVFIPIENTKDNLFKRDLMGVKHLELIKLVKENWVDAGTRKDLSIVPTTTHNVSNTVIIDNIDEIVDYIYENQYTFTAVSFISLSGDKDYNQTPNTEVLSFDEIHNKYGDGCLFASGLIVDGLHYFNNNLWDACDSISNREKSISGTREQVLLKKYWIDRAKKFAKNYFKGSMENCINCLKDVHLFHKWHTINRSFKPVDFNKILTKPEYKNIDETSAVSCSGGACEIVRI